VEGLVLREGVEADIHALLEIEARAAQLLLAQEGMALLAMHSLVADDLRGGIKCGLLRVAQLDGVAVGFALVGELDGHAHLLEMDVDPAHGHQGIGGLLLAFACDATAALGLASMTLVTLREVPWNAPFYARHGFVELEESHWGPGLRTLVEGERMLGFPMSLRVVMRRPL